MLNDQKEPDSQLSESLVMGLADDFLARIKRGEQPDVQDYVDQHPDLETVIRESLAAVKMMLDFNLVDSDESQEMAEQLETRVLGDYRILHEIGRGGMGIVFEAEQISLNRRVALKVLPLSAVLDHRAICRFKNEVLAVAQLDHPNIVDIYGVGFDRGVHHYAMRLVEGSSLSQIIQELKWRREEKMDVPDAISSLVSENNSRQPSHESIHDQACRETRIESGTRSGSSARSLAAHFRSIAELGAVVADALDHAHERGIVHRDIKPSNLMLDPSGIPWITDFGLAHVENATQLTMAGDLLGTARYMSPEQVAGKRVGIDHRTDIYSLGMTLYEMLTLRPPFDGESREQLLRQVAFEQPTPLRQLDRNIASDLDTIVLQCIEKNPDDRYATAKELADDLRRFVGNEPIQARRPSTLNRVQRWVRKRPGYAASLVVALLVIALIATFSSVFLNSQRNIATGALKKQAELNVQLDDSLRATEEQRRVAEEGLDTARSAINDMLFEVAQTHLRSAAQTDTLRRRLLLRAAKLYQDVLANVPQGARTRNKTADIWITLGEIEQLMGRARSTAQAFQNAIEILEVEETPNQQTRQLLGYAYRVAAELQSSTNVQAALMSYRKSKDIYRQLLDENSNDVLANGEPSMRENRLNTRLQMGLLQLQVGGLLLANGQKADGTDALNDARAFLVDSKNVNAELAIAEIDWILAQGDKQRLDEFLDRMVESRFVNDLGRVKPGSDHGFQKSVLEFYERVFQVLKKSEDERATTIALKLVSGWKNLLFFYPTAHTLRAKIAEAELNALTVTPSILPTTAGGEERASWRFAETVEMHRALTKEHPNLRNIELLVDLLKAEVRESELALAAVTAQPKTEAKERKAETGPEEAARRHPYRRDRELRLPVARARIEYWEKRREEASKLWPGQAIPMGGPDRDIVLKALPAANGEIFVIGELSAGAWFDPDDPNTQTDENTNFLAIYDSNGTYQRHVDVGELCGGLVHRLTVDSRSNVVVAGDKVVVKFNPDLEEVWRVEMNGTHAITCDRIGNIYVAGAVKSGQALPESVAAGIDQKQREGQNIGYVTKLSSKGDLVWAWQFDSPCDGESCQAIAVDPEGNVLVSGHSSGETTFGKNQNGKQIDHTFHAISKSKSSRTIIESFLAKLSSDGSPIWVRHMTGDPSWINGIVCPKPNQVIISLSKFGVVDMDESRDYGDSRDMTRAGRNAYVVTYDQDGHITRKPYAIQGQFLRYATGLCLDNRGHLFMTGQFSVYISPNPDPDSLAIHHAKPLGTEWNRDNCFIIELTEDAEYVDHWTLLSPGTASSRSIASDNKGRIIVAGTFPDVIIMPNGEELGSAGDEDGYLMILDPRGT